MNSLNFQTVDLQEITGYSDSERTDKDTTFLKK